MSDDSIEAALARDLVAALLELGAPTSLPALGIEIHGRLADGDELATLRRSLAALERRGLTGSTTTLVDGRPETVFWAPGTPPAPSRLPPWASWPLGPATDVVARSGCSPAFKNGHVRSVWTLHRNPTALGGPALAVRRRALDEGNGLLVEVARRACGWVNAEELAREGSARTRRIRGLRGGPVALWVFDHAPTSAERLAWLERRAIEVGALRAPPQHVWVLLPGAPGGPDRAVRCQARRATRRTSPECGLCDLHVSMPMHGFSPDYRVDLLDLAVRGTMTMGIKASAYTISASEPTRAMLEAAAQARRGKPEDRWFREHAQEFIVPLALIRITSGEAALAELGLKLPCSSDEVGRAFRRRVTADRAHPDQGGSSEEFRELIRLRQLALGYVERSAMNAPLARWA